MHSMLKVHSTINNDAYVYARNGHDWVLRVKPTINFLWVPHGVWGFRDGCRGWTPRKVIHCVHVVRGVQSHGHAHCHRDACFLQRCYQGSYDVQHRVEGVCAMVGHGSHDVLSFHPRNGIVGRW